MENRKLRNFNRVTNVIAFTKMWLLYGWLGNMAPFLIVHVRKKHLTSEALFQCPRYEGLPEVQEPIRGCPSPMGAKLQAKKHKHT
jgi:hypothetical protein